MEPSNLGLICLQSYINSFPALQRLRGSHPNHLYKLIIFQNWNSPFENSGIQGGSDHPPGYHPDSCLLQINLSATLNV